MSSILSDKVGRNNCTPKYIKNDLMQLFKSLVYSKNEEDFLEIEAKFFECCSDIRVKVGDKYDLLSQYYDRNWKSVAPMWVKYFRRDLPTLGDNTSNRVEHSFWTLKKSLKDTFITLPDTATSVIHLIQFYDIYLQ